MMRFRKSPVTWKDIKAGQFFKVSTIHRAATYKKLDDVTVLDLTSSKQWKVRMYCQLLKYYVEETLEE